MIPDSDGGGQRPPKPTAIPPDFGAVPTAMRGALRWVLWAYCWVADRGGWQKLPLRADVGVRESAKSNDPVTWAGFESARRGFARSPRAYDGIGFMLGDGWAGIDLDDVRDPITGELLPWAAEFVGNAATYAEVSPSGSGVKLYGRTDWSGKGKKRLHPRGGSFEVYSGGRYFAVTGAALPGSPTGIGDIGGSIRELLSLADRIDDGHRSAGAGGAGPRSDSAAANMLGRAAAYLVKVPPSVSAASGHDALMAATRALVTGFLLSDAQALALLRDHFNPRCSPPWSEAELRHKIEQCRKHPSSEPDGYLLRSDRNHGGKSGGTTPGTTDATPKGRHGETAPALRYVPDLVCAKDVKPQPVAWLWPGRVPLGHATLIAGRPGLGKTLLLCDVAARVSRGERWPDGGASPAGEVLILSAEDDPASTLRPRLEAAGADLARVHFLKGKKLVGADGKEQWAAVDLVHGLDTIREVVEGLPGLKLMVIDPIGSYVGAKTDGHRDNEVRAALAGVIQLAADRGFALALVAHLNKSALNPTADNAVLGSVAFTAAARAVLHVMTDPNDKDRRLFMPGKCNLAVAPKGLAFAVEEVAVPHAGQQPRIVWCPAPVEGTADDYLGAEGGRSGGMGGDKLEDAKRLLRELLAGGPVPQGAIKQEAEDADVSWATVLRAKKALGVESKRRPGKVGEKGRPWYWGIGDDWEVPDTESRGDPSRAREASQGGEHLRSGGGENSPETARTSVGAQHPPTGERLRDGADGAYLRRADGHSPEADDSTPETAPRRYGNDPWRGTVFAAEGGHQ